MLVFVNGLADAVLLTIDASLLGFGEMPVVRRHVFLLAVLHIRLSLFEVGGLLCAELSTLNAIGNALLLVLFALVNFIHTWVARIDNSGTSARSVG